MTLPTIRIFVSGTVQGVGFRPFVYRVARDLGLAGCVRNDARGVTVIASGARDRLDRLVSTLMTEYPPLAVIRDITTEDITTPDGLPDQFIIEPSAASGALATEIPRDSATCAHCLRELFDPADRRYLHPFITCTDCGPRYTIIDRMPYDRPHTTMAGFPLCPDCSREYHDPASRRFHAQPVCCPHCGPRLQLLDADAQTITLQDPLVAAARMLDQGKVVAIKGLGGFHLACRADRADAVRELRNRKQREEKPFAVMVRDVEIARCLGDLSSTEERLLTSPERPIVLVTKRRSGTDGLASEVAPGMTTLGIFLPYTPLHHLLFHFGAFSALVMTSANRTDEPIVFTNDRALTDLRGVADAILLHDRDIRTRNDDSIVRIMAHEPLLLRRARGFVPASLPAPGAMDGIVACGAMLKSTIAVGRGNDCFLSQHIGDAENAETLATLEETITNLVRLTGVKVRTHVCDLHPQYLSTAFAEQSGYPLVRVQHHHAHAAACMAENKLAGPALAVVYDGTGYGDDGTIWGGEILLATYADYKRLAHFKVFPLPGGEAAIRYPGRAALAALAPFVDPEADELCTWMDAQEKLAVRQMLNTNTACTPTSSVGRLFDALAAILGLCRKRAYEGQPAILLEGAANPHERGDYGLHLQSQNGIVLLDGAGMLHAAWQDFLKGSPVGVVAGRFHNSITRSTIETLVRLSAQTGVTDVVLSGGCFQNVLLTERLLKKLPERGLHAYAHRLVPPNDGCIAYGQAVVAGWKNIK